MGRHSRAFVCPGAAEDQKDWKDRVYEARRWAEAYPDARAMDDRALFAARDADTAKGV